MGKVIKSEMWGRIEHLMLIKGWTWHQMAGQIDLSTGMLSMVKTGARALSKKAVYRLELLEKEAGIVNLSARGHNSPDQANLSARGQVDPAESILTPHAKPKSIVVREDSTGYGSLKSPTPGKDLVSDFQRLEKMVADVAAELSKMRRKMEGGQ